MNVTSYASPEAMMADLQKDMQEADASVKPWQEKAAVGMYYLRLMPELDLVVYGEILDPAQSARAAGADEQEVEATREQYAQEHMRHYRFTRSYSQACACGELGDVHVGTIGGFLTGEGFEAARAQGWPTDPAAVFLLRPFRQVP
jgi:hypothetical protein